MTCRKKKRKKKKAMHHGNIYDVAQYKKAIILSYLPKPTHFPKLLFYGFVVLVWGIITYCSILSQGQLLAWHTPYLLMGLFRSVLLYLHQIIFDKGCKRPINRHHKWERCSWQTKNNKYKRSTGFFFFKLVTRWYFPSSSWIVPGRGRSLKRATSSCFCPKNLPSICTAL